MIKKQQVQGLIGKTCKKTAPISYKRRQDMTTFFDPVAAGLINVY